MKLSTSLRDRRVAVALAVGDRKTRDVHVKTHEGSTPIKMGSHQTDTTDLQLQVRVAVAGGKTRDVNVHPHNASSRPQATVYCTRITARGVIHPVNIEVCIAVAQRKACMQLLGAALLCATILPSAAGCLQPFLMQAISSGD